VILEENTQEDLGEMGITGEVGFQKHADGETILSQALQYVYKLLVHRWGLLPWVWAIDSCRGGSRKRKVEEYEAQFCFVVGTKKNWCGLLKWYLHFISLASSPRPNTSE